MTGNGVAVVRASFELPAILQAAGPRARKRVFEFFGASIRNENTLQGLYEGLCRVF
jgi:hypothetical protein